MANKDDDNLGSFYMGRTRQPAKPQRRFPTGVLTAAVLFVFAGILWYAYPRGAEKYKDIDIPVVKADTAPIKAEPVDPGGMEVPHQDSTIFDPVAKKDPNEVEKLMPVPEEPMDKDKEIQPMAAVPPQEPVEKPSVESLMPKKQEMAEAAPAKAPEEKKITPPVTSPVAAKAVKNDGTVYIQLGALNSIDAAKEAWAKLQRKYPQSLKDLEMKTQKVEIANKGTFYRLQAGKLTEARAKEICASMKAEKASDCIIVRP